MGAMDQANRTYHVAQESMALLPNYYRWTYGAFADQIRGRVVELGSGSGLGIGTYLDRVDHVLAVDHDDKCLAEVKRRWPDAKVETRRADLLGDWRELDGVQADAVLMLDVVEHFADDAALVRKAAELLRPGGSLLIKVPAQADAYSEIDKASGHFRRYDREHLEAITRAAGLETVTLSPINRLGAIAYRARKDRRSNFSRTFTPGQLKLINRLLPVIRLGDALPGLPGLSLVGGFRKR